MSFFDEKRSAVKTEFTHGKWWQTVHELHMEIPLPKDIKSRQIQVTIKPSFISVAFATKLLFEGKLAKTVKCQETVWTAEDGQLYIVLTNAQPFVNENMWTCLLEDGSFGADPLILLEMRKYLDLEKFQIENPGFDFSGAKLSKTYDKMPS